MFYNDFLDLPRCVILFPGLVLLLLSGDFVLESFPINSYSSFCFSIATVRTAAQDTVNPLHFTALWHLSAAIVRCRQQRCSPQPAAPVFAVSYVNACSLEGALRTVRGGVNSWPIGWRRGALSCRQLRRVKRRTLENSLSDWQGCPPKCTGRLKLCR